jgi:hypothetical protein
MASIGAMPETRNLEKDVETFYRFLTPECEVRMSVQQFGKSSSKDFRFLERLTGREFCLSPKGAEDPDCQLRFSGAIAVAVYHFYPHSAVLGPVKMRERVLTIDHDSRMSPRPPFERTLAIERDSVSDIQAFGYNRDEPGQAPPTPVWSLLHQDLYLNDQASPFLITHWKHTLDLIRLIDVIPGDQTKVLQ